MKLETPHTLKEISELLDCEFIGPADLPITGLNEIHKVEAGDIVFVDHPKYYDKALNSAATVVLINKKVDCPEGKGLLISEDPFKDYNKLTVMFSPFYPWTRTNNTPRGISPYAVIQPNVTIGRHVEIGKNSWIHSGAVIYDHVKIGDNVIIHSNTVIGSDAFYYQFKDGAYRKMHTCGRVIIGDDVEIGSGCTIDRGVSGDTVIGKGTKIDNSVHVGHDTVIGEHCLFAAQVGIAGCTTIGNNVKLWGQVGVSSDIIIGDNVEVLAQSGVGKDLESGKRYFGSPAGEAREMFKQMAAVRNLGKKKE